jgi:BRCT domain type II-containing protein
MSFKEAEDADSRGRIGAIEENANQHSDVIMMLQDKATQLSRGCERLGGEVSALRSARVGIQIFSQEAAALKMQIAKRLRNSVLDQCGFLSPLEK